MTNAELAALAMRHHCGFCGASAGVDCMTKQGRTRDPHVTRYVAAAEQHRRAAEPREEVVAKCPMCLGHGRIAVASGGRGR